MHFHLFKASSLDKTGNYASVWSRRWTLVWQTSVYLTLSLPIECESFVATAKATDQMCSDAAEISLTLQDITSETILSFSREILWICDLGYIRNVH